MKQIRIFKLSALAVATTLACSPAAFATNGYFVHGYGTQTNGMGGAGVALPMDSIAAATNPAGMALVGSRADVSVALFSPKRDGRFDASGIGSSDSGSIESGATMFAIPNMGFVMDMAGMTMGISVYANGGMNTRYNTNIYDTAFFGPAGSGMPNTGTLGVNLAQLLVAPTVAMKLSDDHSVGGSLVLGYQRFRAYGLGDFAAFGFSSDSSNMTNRGDDDAFGAGARIGWTGQMTDSFSVGATYSSKVYMQEFDRYKGLFAEQGDFDIPANYAVGIALKATPEITLAFDVERIMYEGVAAVSNPGPTPTQFTNPFIAAAACTPGTDCLGDDAGFGFGWENQTVYKLGVNYKYSEQWTFRGGFNYGKSPIPEDQNLFNILAPGVVEKHVTVGFTYSPDQSSEVSVAYMHAFRKDQSFTYDASANLGPGASYTADIGMHQDSVEAGYSFKF